MYKVSKEDFERTLHGNRAIKVDSKGLKRGDVIQIACTDWQTYSYSVYAEIASIPFINKVKVKKGYRLLDGKS